MRHVQRFVVPVLLALALVLPALPASASSTGAEVTSREKKRSKKKDRGKKKKEEPAVQWEWSGGPFTHFLWLARQMPDFKRFPKATKEIRLSIVAHRKKSLLFLDSCLAKPKNSGWLVSKCNAVQLHEKEFLARIVKGGTDTTAAPDSLKKLQDFIAAVKKTRKREELLPLLLEESVKHKQGYQLLNDVDAGLKECGRRDYFKALGSLPTPTYIGPNVVVVDLHYTVERGKSSYKLKASLAKTAKGWRIGGLKVQCY